MSFPLLLDNADIDLSWKKQSQNFGHYITDPFLVQVHLVQASNLILSGEQAAAWTLSSPLV